MKKIKLLYSLLPAIILYIYLIFTKNWSNKEKIWVIILNFFIYAIAWFLYLKTINCPN